MSRKNALDPQEQQAIIKDYKQAFRLARGEDRLKELKIFYKKGWFYLGLENRLPIPYRREQILKYTENLRKQIPPRPDSDEDGEMD